MRLLLSLSPPFFPSPLPSLFSPFPISSPTTLLFAYSSLFTSSSLSSPLLFSPSPLPPLLLLLFSSPLLPPLLPPSPPFPLFLLPSSFPPTSFPSSFSLPLLFSSPPPPGIQDSSSSSGQVDISPLNSPRNSMVASPIIVSRGPNGYGMILKSIRVYIGESNDYRIHHIIDVRSYWHLASFPGSCAGEEEREPGTHCSRMHQVPLVTCILLRYTKITVNCCLPAEGRTA